MGCTTPPPGGLVPDRVGSVVPDSEGPVGILVECVMEGFVVAGWVTGPEAVPDVGFPVGPDMLAVLTVLLTEEVVGCVGPEPAPEVVVVNLGGKTDDEPGGFEIVEGPVPAVVVVVSLVPAVLVVVCPVPAMIVVVGPVPAVVVVVGPVLAVVVVVGPVPAVMVVVEPVPAVTVMVVVGRVVPGDPTGTPGLDISELLSTMVQCYPLFFNF